MKRFLVLLFPIMLVSCATFDMSLIDDLSIRLQPDPLRVSIACEPFFIRVDVNRDYELEMFPVFSERQLFFPLDYYEIQPYSELCVDFGNGLMMDANKNLFLELTRFYGLAGKQDFRITMNDRADKPKTLLALNDGVFVMQKLDGGKALRTVSFVSDMVVIKNTFLYDGSRTILTEPGAIAIVGPAGYRMIQADTNTALVDSLPFGIVRSNADKVEAGGVYELVRSNDRIEIRYFDPDGVTRKYTFFRIADGCVFYSEYGDVVEVLRNGSLVRCQRNGRTEASYTIGE